MPRPTARQPKQSRRNRSADRKKNKRLLCFCSPPSLSSLFCYSKRTISELENPDAMSGLIAFLSFPLELVARSNGAGHRSRRFRPSKNWRGRLSRSRTTRRGSTSTRTAAPAASSWPTSTWTCSSRCQPSPRINSFKVHRLLITSVMVAAKFVDDM
ncbi:hypothetical protein SAY86_007633 [Trapa natans]|uniref:Uncharacterized protein n=1 Tax=Trapa natans TaxID=22666 RepID=A0AAN7QX59_TRANT|nr:hypothetical protein SAY86_007633 [Trapa natans]